METPRRETILSEKSVSSNKSRGSENEQTNQNAVDRSIGSTEISLAVDDLGISLWTAEMDDELTKQIPEVVTYQSLADGPKRSFEKYLLVSPTAGLKASAAESEVWTEVPSLIACLVVTFREKHDEDIKSGRSFILVQQRVVYRDVRRLCGQLWPLQNDWSAMRDLLQTCSTRLTYECMREILRRLETPLLQLSQETVDLLNSGDYEKFMIHRSAQLETLVQDAQDFVSFYEKSSQDITNRLHKLYNDDGLTRSEENKAKNDLRGRVRKDLLTMEPVHNSTLRFVMRNMNQQFNYFIYKTVWRMRMQKGMSHKEAKGVIQPEIELLALERLSRDLGPVLIGLPDEFKAKLAQKSDTAVNRFRVKVFKDILTFVAARCWFNFEKKKAVMEGELQCHPGCTCGFGGPVVENKDGGCGGHHH